jgi:hypothetical protein
VAHVASRPAACAVAVTLLTLLGYRLLAERARRRTLIETFAYVPGGTVVFQKAGPGGPAVCVWIGDGHRPAPEELPGPWPDELATAS